MKIDEHLNPIDKLSTSNTTANKSQSISKISYHNPSVKSSNSNVVNYSNYASSNMNLLNNGKKSILNEMEKNKYSTYHK